MPEIKGNESQEVMDYRHQVVTLDDIRKALSCTVGRKGFPDDNINNLADYLMNFFGYNEYVIDNVLNSEDRDVFYMLEDEGLLKTSHEEISLLKGKMWRIHYWILKKKDILEYARGTPEKAAIVDESSSVYANLDDEVWSHKTDVKTDLC